MSKKFEEWTMLNPRLYTRLLYLHVMDRTLDVPIAAVLYFDTEKIRGLSECVLHRDEIGVLQPQLSTSCYHLKYPVKL